MIRSEIDKKLDALAARHLMGWKLSFSGRTWRTPDNVHQSCTRLWTPTTDPMAFQKLKDAARSDGWRITVTDSISLGAKWFSVEVRSILNSTISSAQDNNEFRAVITGLLRACGVGGV